MTEAEHHCSVCGTPIAPSREVCSSTCRKTELDEDDRSLEKAIIQMLKKREPDKTICPSEPPRQLFPDNWRDYMERSRCAAGRLWAQDAVDIQKSGESIAPDDITGPIRLGRGSRFKTYVEP